MNQNIYLCDDTVEGIFTAIYMAWASKNGHHNNKIVIDKDNYNQELFSTYIRVEAKDELAFKVMDSIPQKISSDAYEMVMQAAASNAEGKADAIYRFLILGFAMGQKVTAYLNNSVVNEVFKMSRFTGNEAHHYYGFLRFEELDNHALLAKIRPKNDILTMIAPHFSDRFMSENFMIADMGRDKMVFHVAEEGWFCSKMDDMEVALVNLKKSNNEMFMQELWRDFVDTIGIKERHNLALQRQILPLRFREFMSEFQS